MHAARLLEEDEWQAAYVLNKKKPSKDVSRLNTVMRLVAPLEEGFLGPKGDGEPGVPRRCGWVGVRSLYSCGGCALLGCHYAMCGVGLCETPKQSDLLCIRLMAWHSMFVNVSSADYF